MLPYARMYLSSVLRRTGVVVLAITLAVVLTYPLAFKLDSVGRIDSGDGQWSLWCVTWVAHALTSDPANLFNANIFYPHRYTLAYSEANIVPGILGIPAYLITGNPFATHNSVVLLAFIFSFLTAYGLARYLTDSTAAGILCGIAFAYCPFIFARTAHIQLLMTFGIPWAMHMLHRLVDRPTFPRAFALSATLIVQALACAYYGVFAGLSVALAVLYYAQTRRLWKNGKYWFLVGLSAATAVSIVAPFFVPYQYVQGELGFTRTLKDAAMYSADWKAWFASSAWTHRWMLPLLRRWSEVLFPGFMIGILGLAGVIVALRWRRPQDEVDRLNETASLPRETVTFYSIVGVIALWASFGPKAWLYTVLFHTIPVFSFLRAPARFGIMVTLVLSLGLAFLIARLLNGRTIRAQALATVPLAFALACELATIPLGMTEAEPVNVAYRLLANLRRGPVVELPFFYERPDFPRHAEYMLNSTFHWQPLINGYSDHIPQDFRAIVLPMSSFPTRQSFEILRRRDTRYVVIHLGGYDERSVVHLQERLERYKEHLALLSRKDDVLLYEIVSWPAASSGPPQME